MMMEETTTATQETTANEGQSQPEQGGSVKPALFDEPEEHAENTQPEVKPEEGVSAGEVFKAEEITLPEGEKYDAELGRSFAEILNDGNLSRKELGQKLFDLYHSQSVKILEGLKSAEAERAKTFEAELAQEKAQWLKQCQADTEYGGQNWEGSQAVIDRGCKLLATPEAVSLMQRYNLNTHPEIVRMFYRAGKLAGEDKSQVAGNGSGRSADPATAIFGESLKEYYKRKGDKD